MTSMVTSCTLLSRAAPTAKLPRGALQSGEPAAVALQRKPRSFCVRCAAADAVPAFGIVPFGSYICMRPRRPWRQAAVLPFSSTPNKYRRRPSALCASINISPDALVHPSREEKKQQGITVREGTEQWVIKDEAKCVKLRFVITDIVGKSNDVKDADVKDAVKVALHHDDVLVISEKKTNRSEADDHRGALDVRLLMTPGYDGVPDCRWEKDDRGEVTLEVTINKRNVPRTEINARVS